MDTDGVVEGCRRQNLIRRQVFPHHLDDAAGNDRPSASVIAIMVAAVPITMQVPNERAMPPSISFHSSSPMRPARFSSHYSQASEPEPSGLPRQLPRSIGPAGT